MTSIQEVYKMKSKEQIQCLDLLKVVTVQLEQLLRLLGTTGVWVHGDSAGCDGKTLPGFSADSEIQGNSDGENERNKCFSKIIDIISEQSLLCLPTPSTCQISHNVKDCTEFPYTARQRYVGDTSVGAVCGILDELVDQVVNLSQLALAASETFTTQRGRVVSKPNLKKTMEGNDAEIEPRPKRRRGRPPKNKDSQYCKTDTVTKKIKMKALKTAGDRQRVKQQRQTVSSKRKNPHPRKLTQLENKETKAVEEDPSLAVDELNEKENDEANDVDYSASVDQGSMSENEDDDDDYKPDRKMRKRRWKHRRKIVHVCKICKEWFTHGRSFNAHLQTHVENQDHGASCRACKTEFPNTVQYIHHECKALKEKIKGKQRDCKYCNRVFTNYKKWQYHMKTVHHQRVLDPTLLYCCLYCGKGYSRKSSLYIHYKDHALEGQVVCQKCGEFLDNEAAFIEHNKGHEEEAQFFCDLCNMSFIRRQQYKQHLEAHQKYTCNVCQQSFSINKQLIKHKKIAHRIKGPSEPKKYACLVCDKRFVRPGLLDIHIRLHTGEKPIECPICHMYFRTPKAFAKHKQTRTHLLRAGELPRERDHLCSICGKAFFRKHALQRHMQYHSEDRPHCCPHCDFKCKEPNNLKRHIALHFSSERNFVCDVCGAAFHTKKTLQTHHVYKHSEQREFPCSDCNLSFKTPNALKRHEHVHSNDRPHKCYCGQAFLRLYNLRRHMKHLHGTDAPLPPVRRLKTVDMPEGEAGKGSSKDFDERSFNAKIAADRSLAEQAMASIPVRGQVGDPQFTMLGVIVPNSESSTATYVPNGSGTLLSVQPAIQQQQPQQQQQHLPQQQQTQPPHGIQVHKVIPTAASHTEKQEQSFVEPTVSLSQQQGHIVEHIPISTGSVPSVQETYPTINLQHLHPQHVVYQPYPPPPHQQAISQDGHPVVHQFSEQQVPQERVDYSPEVYAAMTSLVHFMHNAQ
ncbi:zinc finger protein 37 [Lingula anatina]|uniref:Zinc finger protein 37 n=1 Tax=Lingula anatina TaxID=7574 RepID=A0A1S3IZ47_LINAN|nr:zinc finger protein 37 [Lingula anatina]XP_013403481.1 zinc finger protein 37 [Lingula anatina]|eukprot:XP_013403480.1 zinc finger protein 37 [Lingula anatina]